MASLIFWYPNFKQTHILDPQTAWSTVHIPIKTDHSCGKQPQISAVFHPGLGWAKQHFLQPQGAPITLAAGNGPGAEVMLHLLRMGIDVSQLMEIDID